MKLFLHLEIGHWRDRGYDRSWLHFASSLSGDVVGTDLDNESEGAVSDLVVKLISQAQKVFVLVEAHDSRPPPGAVGRILTLLSANPALLDRVVLLGHHLEAAQSVRLFGDKATFENDVEVIRKWIREFAQ